MSEQLIVDGGMSASGAPVFSAHAATRAQLPARHAWRADEWLTVTVPASSANLGPGFDSIGLGLSVWDTASVRVSDLNETQFAPAEPPSASPPNHHRDDGDLAAPAPNAPDSTTELARFRTPIARVEHDGVGSDGVPRDASHLVVRTMLTTWEALGLPTPNTIELRYHGSIPHSRGMGSSATAIVAGVGLATAVAGYDLSEASVLAFVNDVAGAIEGHPDNTSASVYGRVTVSWFDESAWRTAVVEPHESIEPVVVVPDVRLDTSVARAALPAQVPLAIAAANSGRAALLTHALSVRPDLLWDATRDYLHQEQRRPAYPDAMRVVDVLRAQRIPAAISGAGPTVLALASGSTVETVESVVRDVAGAVEVLRPGIAKTGLHEVAS